MAFHSTYSPTFDCLATVGAASPTTALGNNTLAAWVNFNSLATDGEIIEVNANGGGNGSFDSAILYSLASAKLEFTQRTSTTNRDFVATFTVTTNTWIHVALTWDGTNLLAYANGVQIGSNTTGAMAGTRGNWGGLQLGPATADIQDGVFYTAALSADEILSLYREREPKRRTNLFCHVPCFPGTNRGVDLSGNALNLPASGTPVDSTIVPPSVGWGTGRTRLILPTASAVAAIGDGRTVFNGSGAQTAAAAESGTGQTVFNGSGAQTAAAAKVGDGRTLFNGSAAPTLSVPGDGRTVFNGSGTQTAAVAKAGDGRTVFNGAATALVSIAASADGRTLFNASAATGQTGTGATLFNGSATASVSVATTADGRTVFNGTSTASAVVPVADVPQRFIRAPRETIWITSNPFNPTTYTSVLGSKLLEYWHSEQGISLDGSSNVQTWAGQFAGFVLSQSTAGSRPTYGPDGTNFNSKNVVQAATAAARWLEYNPGTSIFAADDRPAIVHVSRLRVVSAGTFTSLVQMNGTGSQRLEDQSTPAVSPPVRERLVFVTPPGTTRIVDAEPSSLIANITAFGLSRDEFQISVNGQIQAKASAVGGTGTLTTLSVGARPGGSTPSASSFGMVFLLRNMATQFELLQLYGLAKAEWGI